MQTSKKYYCPSNDELRTARRMLRSRGEFNEIICNIQNFCMHCFIHTEKYSKTSFSPTTSPIQEENIYDQPHTSTECSSPPPTGPEYYNYSAILRNQQSQQSSQATASAMVHTGTCTCTCTVLLLL